MKDKLTTNVRSEQVAQPDAKPLLPAVFLSGKDKVEQFQKELKALLAKYDAEIEIQDFGRNWSTDEKIVVTFAWDKELSDKVNDGIVPDWVVGRWENGR